MDAHNTAIARIGDAGSGLLLSVFRCGCRCWVPSARRVLLLLLTPLSCNHGGCYGLPPILPSARCRCGSDRMRRCYHHSACYTAWVAVPPYAPAQRCKRLLLLLPMHAPPAAAAAACACCCCCRCLRLLNAAAAACACCPNWRLCASLCCSHLWFLHKALHLPVLIDYDHTCTHSTAHHGAAQHITRRQVNQPHLLFECAKDRRCSCWLRQHLLPTITQDPRCRSKVRRPSPAPSSTRSLLVREPPLS